MIASILGFPVSTSSFRVHRREVADSSRGVAAALQTVAHYQRRSDAVLVHLLGRSYGTGYYNAVYIVVTILVT